MALGEVDRRFLAYRRERSRFGLWAFPLALVVLGLAWVGIWAYLPLAVNPWTVLGRIESNTFEPGTLTMYAMLCTVLVNVLFVVLSTFLVFCMLWARHERRYLRLAAAAAAETSALAAREPAVSSGETGVRQ